MTANKMKLPLAHPTTITWVTMAAIATMVAAYVAWALWFAEPMYKFL